jgi:hypothetical protein
MDEVKKCSYCDYIGLTLSQHLIDIHAIHDCSYCLDELKTQDELNKHIQNVH